MELPISTNGALEKKVKRNHLTDGVLDGRSDGRSDGWSDGRSVGRTAGRTVGRTVGRAVERTDGRYANNDQVLHTLPHHYTRKVYLILPRAALITLLQSPRGGGHPRGGRFH